MNYSFFDILPEYGTFLILTAFILLFYEIGYQLTHRYYLKETTLEPKTLGQITGGLIGMWAFVLAFTFSIVANQYQDRKKLVMDEANAIGTAFLRADLIDPNEGVSIKKQLANYVEVRLDVIKTRNLKNAIEKSLEIHKNLWSSIKSVSLPNPNVNTSLLTQSINEIIDIHEKRVTAGTRTRIPFSIWLTLFTISFLAILTLGIQAGYNQSRKVLIVIPLIMAFSSLTTLIVDLNNPQSGSIQVDQEPLISLQKSMQSEGY